MCIIIIRTNTNNADERGSVMTEQEIQSLLRANGVRPTQQRVAVYQYLAAHPIHPTAETIYRELIAQ